MSLLKTYSIEASVTAKKCTGSKLMGEIRAAACVDKLNSISVNDDVLLILGDAILNESLLDSTVLAHDGIAIVDPILTIKRKYNAHKQAGIKYFNSYRASVVLDMLAETITEADAIAIDRLLKFVKSFIIDGDWKTGKAELDDVVVNSAFTQTMKDSILSDFNTYIASNY